MGPGRAPYASRAARGGTAAQASSEAARPRPTYPLARGQQVPNSPHEPRARLAALIGSSLVPPAHVAAGGPFCDASPPLSSQRPLHTEPTHSDALIRRQRLCFSPPGRHRHRVHRGSPDLRARVLGLLGPGEAVERGECYKGLKHRLKVPCAMIPSKGTGQHYEPVCGTHAGSALTR